MKINPLRTAFRKGVFALALLSAHVGASHALAATYTVTNLRDSGSGSLRDAITRANNHAGADTVKFTAGLTGEITLSSTLPQLQGDVSIHGPGAQRITVSANSNVFDVSFGTVNISDLTIAGRSCDPRGIVHNGSAQLTITDAIVTNKSGSGRGTGIINDAGGTLFVQDSAIVRNETGNASGGGVYNAGTAYLTNVTLANNKANKGGGVFNAQGASLSLVNTTVADNNGGGVYSDLFSTVTVANSLIARNKGDDIIKRALDSNGNANNGGPVLSLGGNVIGAAGSSTGWVATDKRGFSTKQLRMGALANKGGQTLVVELLPGSPAIDAGLVANSIDPTGTPLEYCQRGAPYDRNAGASVDAGAFEFGAIVPPQNAHQWKELALTTIADFVPSGSDEIDYYLTQASNRISRSLDPDLWKDNDHLQSFFGLVVFEREKQAVWYLQQVYGDAAAEDGAASAIAFLLNADQRLAMNALDEAGPTGRNHTASGLFNDGNSALAAFDYWTALTDFEWAWFYSQICLSRNCRDHDDDPDDCRYDRWFR